MPFDTSLARKVQPAATAGSKPVAIWLFCLCGMLIVMIVLGGSTRLSGAGLSIMEWAPFRGALPPANQAEWQRLFDLYRQIPQYQLLNDTMDLAGFKQIFWIEWVHRLWGRLLGFAFLVPFLWLWAKGHITHRLAPRLVLLFVLGGLQGAIGWFMVASGFLPDTTSVSPYRLIIHLALALVLYVALLWTGLSELGWTRFGPPPAPKLRRLIALVCALISVTILAGGFVAGTHAGFDYNTFPLMDGRLVPEGYARLHPLLRNLTENIAAVQFDHRLLATLTVLVTAGTIAAGIRLAALRRSLLVLGGAVAAQYALGVVTLLTVVPVPLAVAHQLMAVMVLTAAVTTLHAAGGRRRSSELSFTRMCL
jgi:heme a synthase